jgi:hypothetical protein
MRNAIASIAAVLLFAAPGADAAPPLPFIVDHSTDILMDEATASKLWADNLPPRIWKMYSPKKWGFLSQVEGGFTATNTCVITARAMLLPLRGKALVFSPAKTTTTFDIVPNATKKQCQTLAQGKLKEAIQAMAFNLQPS